MLKITEEQRRLKPVETVQVTILDFGTHTETGPSTMTSDGFVEVAIKVDSTRYVLRLQGATAQCLEAELQLVLGS